MIRLHRARMSDTLFYVLATCKRLLEPFVSVLIYRNATRDQSCLHVMLVGFIRTVSNVLATCKRLLEPFVVQ